MKNKPLVWFVDDLQSNLDDFKKAHQDTFEVRTYSKPQEVLDALNEECPDALLCDVFFYDSPQKAKEIEAQINKVIQSQNVSTVRVLFVKHPFHGTTRKIPILACFFRKC